MRILTFEPLKGDEMYPVGYNLDMVFTYIERVYKILKPNIRSNKILNIWCRGSSGAILAALLAKTVKNNCIIHHIKKEGESSHSSGDYYKAETNKGLNIIIDDFMRTGDTLNAIWSIASMYVTEIDFLIICNRYKTPEWKLDFIPKTLIIDQDHIMAEWKDLGKKSNVTTEEEIINF